MADVANKQQTTALFLSTIVTRTRRHTELTKPDGKPVLCQEQSVQFFTQLNCTIYLKVYGALYRNTPYEFKPRVHLPLLFVVSEI